MWQTIGKTIGKIAKAIWPYVEVAIVAGITDWLRRRNDKNNQGSAK